MQQSASGIVRRKARLGPSRASGLQQRFEAAGCVRGEGIDDLDVDQAPAVLHVLAENRRATGLPCRGPEHRVPERQPMLLDHFHGVDEGRRAGGGDLEDAEPVTHEAAGARGREEVLPRRCVKELRKRLYREYAVAPGSPFQKRPTLLVAFAGIAVDRVDEDVGVEGEATFNLNFESMHESTRCFSG